MTALRRPSGARLRGGDPIFFSSGPDGVLATGLFFDAASSGPITVSLTDEAGSGDSATCFIVHAPTVSDGVEALDAAGASITASVQVADGIGGFYTAIAYVGGTTYGSQGLNNGTTVSLTALTGGIASAPAEGDLVIVAFALGSQSAFAISLLTAGYTYVTNSHQDASAGGYAALDFVFAYKRMGPVPDTSFQLGGQAGPIVSGVGVAVHVYRATHESSPIDVTPMVASGIDLTVEPPAVTPATPGALIVVGCGAGSFRVNGFAPPAGGRDFLTGRGGVQVGGEAGMAAYPWAGGSFAPEAWTGAGPHEAWQRPMDSWMAVSLALRSIPSGAGDRASSSQVMNASLADAAGLADAAQGALLLSASVTESSGTQDAPAGGLTHGGGALRASVTAERDAGVKGDREAGSVPPAGVVKP